MLTNFKIGNPFYMYSITLLYIFIFTILIGKIHITLLDILKDFLHFLVVHKLSFFLHCFLKQKNNCLNIFRVNVINYYELRSAVDKIATAHFLILVILKHLVDWDFSSSVSLYVKKKVAYVRRRSSLK